MKQRKGMEAAIPGRTGNIILNSSCIKGNFYQGQESTPPYLWSIPAVLALWCCGLL